MLSLLFVAMMALSTPADVLAENISNGIDAVYTASQPDGDVDINALTKLSEMLTRMQQGDLASSHFVISDKLVSDLEVMITKAKADVDIAADAALYLNDLVVGLTPTK